MAWQKRCFMSEVRQQCLAPFVMVDRRANMAVEVAIRAFADAERPVNVKRERFARLSSSHFWLHSKCSHDATLAERRD